jgi:hypothetical protein
MCGGLVPPSASCPPLPSPQINQKMQLLEVKGKCKSALFRNSVLPVFLGSVTNIDVSTITFQSASLKMLRAIRHVVTFAICLVFIVIVPPVYMQHAGVSSQVVSIFPNFGSFDGGTPVTVTGSGFLNSWTLCTFGSIAQ